MRQRAEDQKKRHEEEEEERRQASVAERQRVEAEGKQLEGERQRVEEEAKKHQENTSRAEALREKQRAEEEAVTEKEALREKERRREKEAEKVLVRECAQGDEKKGSEVSIAPPALRHPRLDHALVPTTSPTAMSSEEESAEREREAEREEKASRALQRRAQFLHACNVNVGDIPSPYTATPPAGTAAAFPAPTARPEKDAANTSRKAKTGPEVDKGNVLSHAHVSEVERHQRQQVCNV